MKHISRKIVFSAFLLMLAMPSIAVKAVVTPTTSKTMTASIKASSLSETQSCAIIIAGDRSDHALQYNIMYGADQAYSVLVNNRGFLPSRVYYLGSTTVGHPKVNATSTYANILYAMTTWLNANTDASHGIVLYLFDHGGTGGMAIPGGTLYASTLNTWLNAAKTSRIIIVYEACESGSFISYLSAPNRIIVTSTDGGHSAYASSNWAYFSESFWGSIATGQTIGDSMVAGWYNVEKNGHVSDQIPLVDDNHDYVGHTPQVVMVWLFPVAFLPNGGDGSDASNTLIQGYGGTLFNPFVIIKVAPYLISKFVDNSIKISVLVENNTPIRNMMVHAIPPGWQPTMPPNPDNLTSGFVMGHDTGFLNLTLTERQRGSGNYSGEFKGAGAPLGRGDYGLNIYAFTDAGISAQAFTRATVNDNGVAPQDVLPPVVAITAPQSGKIVSSKLNVTAIGDDDQGLNKIDLFVDGALVKSVSMPALKPYPALMDTIDTSAYANGNHSFRAMATDNAGLTANQTITVDVENRAPDNTILYDVLFLGAGFILGAVLIGLLRNVRKPGGKGMRVRESPSKPTSPGTEDIRESPSKPGNPGVNEGFDTEMIKGESRPLKFEQKADSRFLKYEIKGEKGMARTANGDVIKPLKAVNRPSTGVSMKTPSSTGKTGKVFPKVEIRNSSSTIKGESSGEPTNE